MKIENVNIAELPKVNDNPWGLVYGGAQHIETYWKLEYVEKEAVKLLEFLEARLKQTKVNNKME